MFADLQLSGIKPKTQKDYLREVDNLAKYFNRPPEELGEDELKEYMLYLVNERHLSEGTFRFYVAALVFLLSIHLKCTERRGAYVPTRLRRCSRR